MQLGDVFTMLFSIRIKSELLSTSKQFCYGCSVHHLSQLNHSCIQMSPAEKLSNYFTITLQQILVEDVIRDWNMRVITLNVSDPDLEINRRKLYSHDWKSDEKWMNKLFKMVNTMLLLENRFLNSSV